MSDSSPQVFVEFLPDDAVERSCELLKDAIAEAVEARGVCHLSLAGGATPHPLYQRLAATAVTGEVPWEKTEVFFGDERDVPHDHAESNFRMVQQTLLDHLPIPPAQVHPMPADAEDLQTGAQHYEQTIRRIVPAGPGGVPQFDLVLLGMGRDGHTASLYVGTPDALAESKKLVIAHFVPALGRNRMTITFPLINAARNVLLFVTGEDKADAVAAMLGQDEKAKHALPAGRIAPQDGNFFAVFDAPAVRKTPLRPGL